MAIVNLKKILPNDNQITISDKVNYNFNQILSAGGGPPGDPGPIGDTGPPGPQGIKGNTGEDGEDGSKWYVGLGTPPPQPTIPIYNKGDKFLSTSDNFIWNFDGTFWQKTTSQLKVSGGEFKEDSISNNAIILQDPNKNLVISSIDYDNQSLDPNTGLYNSKFKLVSSPGVFMELGIDQGGFEYPSTHLTLSMDNSQATLSNGGGGLILASTGNIDLTTTSSIILNSLINIDDTSGKYTGEIVEDDDIVNKGHLDNIIDENKINGAGESSKVWQVVRIGSSPSFNPEASSVIKVRNNIVEISPVGISTSQKLKVTGEIYCEGFVGGAWDQVHESNYVKIGDKLEIWGVITVNINNNNDIAVIIEYPENFGTNNNPSINVTPYIDFDGSGNDGLPWGVKFLKNRNSEAEFKVYSIKRALGLEAQKSYSDSVKMHIHWHAIGGWKNRTVAEVIGKATQQSANISINDSAIDITF